MNNTQAKDWEKRVEAIVHCRKGSMDDKQFEATVKHNIENAVIEALTQQNKEIVKEILRLADSKKKRVKRVANDGTVFKKVIKTRVTNAMYSIIEDIKKLAADRGIKL